MSKPIASPSRTKEILNTYGLHAKKGFGQNFLVDASAAAKIASLAEADGAVIEIGPGIGSLTEQLAMRAKQVMAFEIDDSLIPVLQDVLAPYENVRIVHKDILEADIDAAAEELLAAGCSSIAVIANLPYYITTPVLFRLFEASYAFPLISVMVQKEVADRFAAPVNSPDYGALSVEAQYLYNVRRVFNVPRNCFMPAPNVDSAVVSFEKKQGDEPLADRNDFFAFVKGCFKQRRKTLYNNLREYTGDPALAAELLKEAGLAEGVRAQQLDTEAFVQLYRILKKEVSE